MVLGAADAGKQTFTINNVEEDNALGLVSDRIISDPTDTDLSPTDFLAMASEADVIRWLRQFQIVRPSPLRKLRLNDIIYACLLEPFLREAWREVQAQPGFANRLRQIEAVYALVQSRLEKDGGVPRSELRVYLHSFQRAYEAGQLNHVIAPDADR